MTLQDTHAFTAESLDGRAVIRARCIHPGTGLKITLTFPVDADDAALGRFKERLATNLLRRGCP